MLPTHHFFHIMQFPAIICANNETPTPKKRKTQLKRFKNERKIHLLTIYRTKTSPFQPHLLFYQSYPRQPKWSSTFRQWLYINVLPAFLYPTKLRCIFTPILIKSFYETNRFSYTFGDGEKRIAGYESDRSLNTGNARPGER